MDPILDTPQEAVVNVVRLRRSGWLLGIQLFIVIILNVLPRLSPRVWLKDPDLQSLYLASLGFAFLVLIVLMLFGLYLITRIWTQKEGTVFGRRLLMIGQLVICAYVVVIIAMFVLQVM